MIDKEKLNSEQENSDVSNDTNLTDSDTSTADIEEAKEVSDETSNQLDGEGVVSTETTKTEEAPEDNTSASNDDTEAEDSSDDTATIEDSEEEKPLSIAEDNSKKDNQNQTSNAGAKKGGKGVAIVVSLLAVAIVGVFATLFFTKTGPFKAPSLDDQIAVTVGDIEVSAAEYNYMYIVSTNNFLSTNYSMLAYFGIDFTLPLSEQECTLDPTIGSWADFFRDSAMNVVQYNYGMLDTANKAGFEPSQATYDSIAAALASIESAAESENLSIDEYITEFIGEGITFEAVNKIMNAIYIVSEYTQTIIDGVDISQPAIDAYYEENKDDYDVYSFRNMFFDVTVDPDNAKANADEMFSRLTDDNFKELSDEYLGEETLATLEEGYDYTYAEVDGLSLYDDELKAYLTDPARVAGDRAVIELPDTGYYVVEFVERSVDTSPATTDMKHLLVAFNEDNSEPTDEQREAALTEITALTAQWEEGGNTDELFTELVTANTDDMGSASTGGVYTAITKGQMVTEIEDFLFNPDTAIGDYEIIETVYGYHLTVLTAKGADAYVATITDQLINSAVIEVENEVFENTELVLSDNIDEIVEVDIDLSDYIAVG